MVFYAINFVIIAGVGFLVFCLRHFVQEARPGHSCVRPGAAQPLEVFDSREQADHTSKPKRASLQHSQVYPRIHPAQ